MKKSILDKLLILMVGTMMIISCDDDDSMGDPDPQPDTTSMDTATNKTTGFVVSVNTGTGALTKYFETLPTGTVDISDGTDFQSFNQQDIFEGAFYGQNPNGTEELVKLIVDENGEFQIVGSFATFGRVDPIAIRDAETGVYFDYGNPQSLTVFNPTDMTIIGTIDMGGAEYPRDEETRYRELYIRDNLVFAPLGSFASPIWYNPMVTHIADIDQGTFFGNATVELEGPARHNQYFGNSYVDEAGNLYITDQGDLFTGTPARLHRINSGETTFDLDFELNLAATLNPQNLFFSVYNSFYYIGNGKGIASVTSDTPAGLLEILASVNFNPTALNQDQLNEVQVIIGQSENAAWCLIDLNAQTVTAIDGIPSQSFNHRFTIEEADGLWYLPVKSSTENAYYSYDPATGATGKAFDVVGGEILRFANLANNH
ncbi:MAG: hypothetical protein AAF705_08480 [Bacteroidota bacterium]